ncbi:hypothetical protein GCM10018980_71230 [Streptomyces capoamus]|uniref:Uncharacterized protein n=1 Tax=Streptomyces capoamus TaxID=68183 RepID=A0A919KFG9_9ACTN|nr:hypothetical protein [Streptomyces capoamus]GGW13239.1 hypothetical protein GCM10010501_16000 [Streptomyces libani subsp. rufus]GHG74380.1 hypothetical protein GCM10018980_71230 [Streptomyces capoamus]
MPSNLPPVGAEIPCSALALNCQFEFEGQSASCDLKGGMKYRVLEDPSDPHNSVRLQVTAFRMATTDTKDRVELELKGEDSDPQSTLRLTSQFPPRYEHRIRLPLTVTLELRSRGNDEYTLVTKTPLDFTGHLTQFPPQGDLYRITEPMEWLRTWDRDTVIGRLTTFSPKVGGL